MASGESRRCRAISTSNLDRTLSGRFGGKFRELDQRELRRQLAQTRHNNRTQEHFSRFRAAQRKL